jgi:hypothetical protein
VCGVSNTRIGFRFLGGRGRVRSREISAGGRHRAVARGHALLQQQQVALERRIGLEAALHRAASSR